MADEFTVRIEKIAAGGAGLARVEGKTAFIEGSAPDETVLCRISEDHRSWVRAELIEIIEPSPRRTAPSCDLYGKCGGCNLQHLKYSAQLAAKTAIMEESFVRIGGFSQEEGCLPQIKVIPSKLWGYRNRMQFHSTAGGAWGLKARKTNEIVPIADCPIADPGIRALLQNKAAPSSPPPLSPERFTIYARNGLLLSENGVRQGKTKVLNRELALDIGVFFQSNGAMLEKLLTDLQEIVRNAEKNLPMADLYCGVGTFAVFLGESFPQIDLVEENRTALTLARENIVPFFVDFYAQRSEEWAKNLSARQYSFIIVDPPRQGLDTALTQRLSSNGPPLLAYVSCDPATLARDSKALCEGGYELIELRWYDFYPQTAHIESLAVFSRLK